LLIAGVARSVGLATHGHWRARLVHSGRVLHMVSRELTEGQLSLRAMSLVYTTLLSIVPLVAVSFSVLKGFGVHHRELQPALMHFLAALGEDGAREVSARIIGFVENVDGRLLGGVGLAFLLATVISLLQKAERAFNYAWRVKRPRGLAKRLSDYLIVVLVGPLLVVTAMSIIASLMNTEIVQQVTAVAPLGWVLRVAAKLVPYLLLFAAFTCVYVFLPNTRVRVRPAMQGAAIGALLWQAVGWGFAAFVVTSTQTIAIYSSFAILIIFMFWVCLAWLIVLLGAGVAFYTQHPECVGFLGHETRVSNRLRERIALEAAFLIAQRHFYGLPVWPTETLATHLGFPVEPVGEMLDSLRDAGVLVETSDETPGFVPARDLASIGLGAIYDVARAAGGEVHMGEEPGRRVVAVEGLIAAVDVAIAGALDGQTLRDLAAANPPAPVAAPPPGVAPREVAPPGGPPARIEPARSGQR